MRRISWRKSMLTLIRWSIVVQQLFNLNSGEIQLSWNIRDSSESSEALSDLQAIFRWFSFLEMEFRVRTDVVCFSKNLRGISKNSRQPMTHCRCRVSIEICKKNRLLKSKHFENSNDLEICFFLTSINVLTSSRSPLCFDVFLLRSSWKLKSSIILTRQIALSSNWSSWR